MLHLQFIPFPILITSRLCLRELSEDDLDEVFIQRSHPVINKYIHRKPAENKEEALDWIRKVTHQQTLGNSIQWVIVLKDTNKMIGTICLWNIDRTYCTAEIGYNLHPDFFKQGLMNEALKVVVEYGFQKMNAKRIDAFTNKENTSSLNLLARNGFKRNLEFERTLEDQSELEYNQIYSLLKSKNENY